MVRLSNHLCPFLTPLSFQRRLTSIFFYFSVILNLSEDDLPRDQRSFSRTVFYKRLRRRAGIATQTLMHLERVHLERICQIPNVLRRLYFELNEETLEAFAGTTFRARERGLLLFENLRRFFA
jgi:hypothetical protein